MDTCICITGSLFVHLKLSQHHKSIIVQLKIKNILNNKIGLADNVTIESGLKRVAEEKPSRQREAGRKVWGRILFIIFEEH